MSGTMYDGLIGHYVKVYTDAHVNPVFAGKLAGVEYDKQSEHIKLDPGYNTGEAGDKIGQFVQSDPVLRHGLGTEEFLTECTVAKLAEMVGTRVRIPLERIVAVTEVKELSSGDCSPGSHV